jgi:hypothetical protein
MSRDTTQLRVEQSVPARGSGRVRTLPIFNCRFLIVPLVSALSKINNRQSQMPRPIRRELLLTVFALIILCCLAAPLNAQQADSKVIDSYIAAQAKREKGEEPDGVRKVVQGDLNKDGVDDVAVLYTIEGQNGSNNYIQYLAVFLGTNKGLVFAARTPAGGKNHREAELVSITNGKINLNTVDYGPKDPSCCPTIKGATKYLLAGRRLREIKSRSSSH